MNNSTSNRKLAAIMFADIVSYSRLMGSNETEALKLLKDFENLSIPIVEKSDGIIVKKNGDQIFCEFTSAKNAVDASISIQSKLHKYNDTRPKDFRLEVRIGIHIGDVTVDDGDIFGDGVNVASRIQPLASPGGICISGAVSDAISSHPEYDIISKGKQELKNIIKKHSVFEVKTGYESKSEYPLNHDKSITSHRFSSLWKGLQVLSVILILFFTIHTYNKNSDSIHVEKKSDKKNTILIGNLISDSHYIDDVKWFLSFEYNDLEFLNNTIELLVLPDSLRNFINDELYNYIIVNEQKIENIDIIGKDELDKFYNESKNSLTPDYALEVLSTSRLAFDVEKRKSLDNNDSSKEDSGIVDEYDILDDLKIRGGFFSMIYKFKRPYKDKEYAALTFFLHDFNSHIDSLHFTSIGNAYLFDYDELRDELYKEIINKIDRKVNPSLSKKTFMYVTQVKNNNILFKFSNRTNLLKKGVLLSSERQYVTEVGITAPDSSILNSLDQRLEDLYYIKNIIDKNPESDAYNIFYNTSNLSSGINEIKQILDNTHHLSQHEKEDSLKFAGSADVDLGIKLKVVEIFDSTGSAIIFKVDRNKSPIESFTKLRAGDMLIFD